MTKLLEEKNYSNILIRTILSQQYYAIVLKI